MQGLLMSVPGVVWNIPGGVVFLARDRGSNGLQ